MRPPDRNAGFTLLEMLAALAVIALVSAISIPALRPPSDAMRLEAAARQMAAAMRLTRARAIATNAELDFVVDTRALSYKASSLAETRLPSDFDVKMTVAAIHRASAQGAVRFLPDGGSSGADIELRVGRQLARINVNWLTGEAEVRR